MEYNFTQRKKTRKFKRDSNSNKNENQIPKGKVKDFILGEYDRFTELKSRDQKIKSLSDTQETLSKQIVESVNRLKQCADDTEVSTRLQASLNHMNTLYKNLKSEYTDFLKNQFEILHQQWPEIFDKFIEGIDRNTLVHVLNVFHNMQSGKLNPKDAFNQGLDYMTNTYDLPKDFFNRETAFESFNQQFEKFS